MSDLLLWVKMTSFFTTEVVESLTPPSTLIFFIKFLFFYLCFTADSFSYFFSLFDYVFYTLFLFELDLYVWAKWYL